MSRFDKLTSRAPNVLFLALSGIGNLLMQLPTIAAVKKAWPNSRITVWVAPRGTTSIAEQVPFIDQIIEAKPRRSLVGHAQLAYRLSRLNPDIALMLSPGQLSKGAMYMLLSGAPIRVAHRYPHLGNPTSGFLLAHAVTEQPAMHDIEQNLNLLIPLGIDTTAFRGQPYHWHVSAIGQNRGNEARQRLKIPNDRTLIGFHAGSAPDFAWKRWPLERFAHVARVLIANHNAHVLIFGGPAELLESKRLRQLIGEPHTSLVTTDLITAAGLIKHCQLILANDSGLMHVAAAQGVPTIGIFGPTDEKTTGPRGTKSHVVRAPGTEPVYNTEHNYPLGGASHETLLVVTPALVLDKIARILER